MPRRLAEGRGLAGRLVPGDPGPVERLRRRVAGRGIVRQLAEAPLRLGPVAARLGGVGQPELQLGQEVGRRQVALDAVPLGPVRRQDQDRRGPLGAEALEDLRLLLDVGAGGDEVAADELRDLGMGIDLGLQPSASPSEGRRGEVEEQGPAGLPRLAQCRVDVSLPVDLHGTLLSSVRRALPNARTMPR